MKRLRGLAGCLLALLFLFYAWGPAQAQGTDFHYFDETGHNVVGEFWKFYQRAKDPTLLYGYPITEQFISRDGKTVQYFQRARFEWDGVSIRLTPIGKATYTPGSQLNVYNPLACQMFAETGYPVCFAFLEFFNEYGGVAQFGYPISPFEYHDNMIVQYFENARLEWHPWMPEGQRVAVGDLGYVYFDKMGEDPALLDPALPYDETIVRPRVLSLVVRAFVLKAVTLSSDQQMLFVIVQDQNLRSVANAQGTIVVHWPAGGDQTLPFVTNENGVAIVPLAFSGQPYGNLVYIDVDVTYQGLHKQTTTSFRIWY
ncbi:MAG: hypothetical protein D6770_00025 [Anaerolineae bacterium]|nr:MAG: hypothetical protein D6770_00025 [Anaerolineae bacterium]